MDLRADALLAGAAALAGAVNSVAGGGTLLSFPAAMAWGLPSTIANATNAVAMMPGSLASAWAYRREVRAHARMVKLLAVPAVVGGVAGAMLLHATPVRVFDTVVPWLVLGATLIILFQGRVSHASKSSPSNPRTRRRWAFVAIGGQLVVGVYGGFFGAAMGIVMLALLSLVMEDDIQARNAVKIVLASLINGVASIYFLWTGLVSARAALIMTGGAITGGYVGALLARRTPAPVVRALVVTIGLALTVLLAYRAWSGQRSSSFPRRAMVDTEVGELLRADIVLNHPLVVADLDNFVLGILGGDAKVAWKSIDENVSTRASEEAQVLPPVLQEVNDGGLAHLLPAEEGEQGALDVSYLAWRYLKEPRHARRLRGMVAEPEAPPKRAELQRNRPPGTYRPPELSLQTCSRPGVRAFVFRPRYGDCRGRSRPTGDECSGKHRVRASEDALQGYLEGAAGRRFNRKRIPLLTTRHRCALDVGPR